MRVFLPVAALAGLAAITPSAVLAQKAKAVRQVQLIAMGGPAAADPVAPASPDLAEATPTSLPEAFRVHDLSRRYVEYRMAQEMAAFSTQGGAPTLAYDPTVAASVAPTSSISVPLWMKAASPVIPAVTYMPGCAPLAYRPSGLLRADAESRRAAYYGMMSAIACEHGIPTGLFDAMIMRESKYDPLAISPKKAFGLAQLMPGTANELGVNAYDPAQNMRGGARYLRQQLDKFGQVHLALAAYNAGPGRVRGGFVPRIAETQAYVSNILTNWSRLSGYTGPAAISVQASVRPRREVATSVF